MTHNQLLLELLTIAPALPPAEDPWAALLQVAHGRCGDQVLAQRVCQDLQADGFLTLQAGRWVQTVKGQEVLTLNQSPMFSWIHLGREDTEEDEAARWVGVLNQLGAALDRTGPEGREQPEYESRLKIWAALARNGPYTGGL